ncbi:hypothetical protein SLA2020_265420 [Shorea laevis]
MLDTPLEDLGAKLPATNFTSETQNTNHRELQQPLDRLLGILINNNYNIVPSGLTQVHQDESIEESKLLIAMEGNVSQEDIRELVETRDGLVQNFVVVEQKIHQEAKCRAKMGSKMHGKGKEELDPGGGFDPGILVEECWWTFTRSERI